MGRSSQSASCAAITVSSPAHPFQRTDDAPCEVVGHDTTLRDNARVKSEFTVRDAIGCKAATIFNSGHKAVSLSPVLAGRGELFTSTSYVRVDCLPVIVRAPSRYFPADPTLDSSIVQCLPYFGQVSGSSAD